MTIPEAVANVFKVSRGQAVKALKRLERQGLLKTAQLTPKCDYYYLDRKAAEALQVAAVKGKPFFGTGKVVAYGMLHFCCLQDIYRPKISSKTWGERFEEECGFRSHLKVCYYTEGRKLGYVRIDSQGLGVNAKGKISADPFRVIESCWKDIEKREEQWLKNERKVKKFPEFIKLRESGDFVVTVLTAFEERARRIRARIHRMTEECSLHTLNAAAKAVGSTVGNLRQEDSRRKRLWKKFEQTGKEPRKPPRMEVVAIPDLFEVMYPTSQGKQ